MPATIPDKAFILAAGLGTRLRPLTDDRPKPMVSVLGKPMIDHTLEALKAVGVKSCIVNTHYKADVLHDHLKGRTAPEIILSHEQELLNTGGGIAKMISEFNAPFYIINGDSFWEDTNGNTLELIAQHWNPEKMDILMLLQPVSSMKLTKGVGDYDLDSEGRATRSLSQTGTAMFTSIRINHPRIFESRKTGAQAEPFSYLALMDEAQQKGRLYGILNPGQWHHISTPEDVRSVETAHGG